MARARARAQARGPEPRGIEIDPEDEVEEGDEDEAANALELTPEEKAQLEITDLCEQFGQSGARWTMKFRRIMRPEDVGKTGISPGYVGVLPNQNVTAIRPDMLEEDMFSLWGGGTFDAEFFVDGKYQKGLTKRIEIQGPAKARGAAPTPVAPEGQAPFRPREPEGALTLETLQKILDERARSDRLAQLERENERLRNAPPPVQAGNGPADIVNLVFEKVTGLTRTAKQAEAENPELAAIRAENAAIKKKLEEAAERALERERAENKARFEKMELAIKDGKEKRKKGPLSGIAHDLLEVTAIDSAFAKLTKRAEEDDSGGILGVALKIFEEPVKKAIQKMAKNMVKKINAMQAQQGAQPGQVDRGAWIVWLNTIFTEPTNVQNVDFVRGGLQAFGPYVERLISISDRKMMVDFAKETTTDEIAKRIEDAKPEEWNSMLGLLGVLRQTVVHLATSPSQGPGEEDDDEDEEDDDGDDEDDVTEVEGKVVD